MIILRAWKTERCTGKSPLIDLYDGFFIFHKASAENAAFCRFAMFSPFYRENCPIGESVFLSVYNFVGDVGNIFLSVDKFILPTAVIFVFKFLLFGQPRIKKRYPLYRLFPKAIRFRVRFDISGIFFGFIVLYYPRFVFVCFGVLSAKSAPNSHSFTTRINSVLSDETFLIMFPLTDNLTVSDDFAITFPFKS